MKKYMAITWHLLILTIAIGGVFNFAPKSLVCLALGSLIYHSQREIQQWWNL